MAYEPWLNKYYSRYDDFIRAVIKELNEEDDYEITNFSGGLTRDGRTEYHIRIDALQYLEMLHDKKTRVHYRQL